MQQMVLYCQNLLLAQHVSGTIMPIIRSSRVLYRWLLPVVLGAFVYRLSVWYGAPDDGHNSARNMLSEQQVFAIKNHWLHLVDLFISTY